jgi:hypothetical protein
MISISSNINDVFAGLLAKLARIDAIQVCKAQALETVRLFDKRIHDEGKAADGSQIGVYSRGYMKVRTGNYDEMRLKSGRNKGKFKEKKSQAKADAGLFTKGPRKGQARPTYNLSGDTKVILVLTREMRNKLTIIPLQNGYGVGYPDSFNYNKARWAEARYRKPIFSLTAEEHKIVMDIAQTALKNVLR